MKNKIEEVRDILAGILGRYPSWPVGLIRAHNLLEQVLENDLAEWDTWDENDIITLAPDVEDRFPAA
jgi:hypothetical protein